MYRDVLLLIDGQWRAGAAGNTLAIVNPASEAEIGRLAVAEIADAEEAIQVAARCFPAWRDHPAAARSAILREAARLLRERTASLAQLLTLEQGKPLAQAAAECKVTAELLEWFAEEARRTYGRIIPARAAGIQQLVYKVPVGPVVAFSPWNFPMAQAVRKIGAALAAGCTIVIKGPEETPASCAALVDCLHDAGVPHGVLNLLFGDPATISGHLIPHPETRKISFTGSTAVGKQLAALAGAHMKRVTMELGGHAPTIIFADADIDMAVERLAVAKSRNAGQVCVSPTRFLVAEPVADGFIDGFVRRFGSMRVGDGLEDGVDIGPLANGRRLEAMDALVSDAVRRGARLAAGGKRIGNKGYFYEPTVLVDVPVDARIMNEEPFGPVAVVNRFGAVEEALTEANRLPFGLGAYLYTRSQARAEQAQARIESGMVSINHHGLGVPETPFGGVRDSGYGSEGGEEAIEAYLVAKFVTQTGFAPGA